MFRFIVEKDLAITATASGQHVGMFADLQATEHSASKFPPERSVPMKRNQLREISGGITEENKSLHQKTVVSGYSLNISHPWTKYFLF